MSTGNVWSRSGGRDEMKDIRRKVRRTQTITPFGVGGIIDLQGESFVAADIRSWGNQGDPVESPRLARKLGVRGFRSAAVIPSGKSQYVSRRGPGYVRFPRWLFCPKCRVMTLWRHEAEQRDRPPRCGRCPNSPQQAPMRFIQVCRDGHMGDIDWQRWAHSRAEGHDQRQCRVRSLKFVATPDSSGLDALKVMCIVCGAYRTLEGISQKHALKQIGVRCSGSQPWQTSDDEGIDCEETPRAAQRGASNVYFPLVHSVIEIPNPSDLNTDDEAARRVMTHSMWEELIETGEAPITDVIVNHIAKKCDVSAEFVESLRRAHTADTSAKPEVNSTIEDLSIAEWAAFTSSESEKDSTADFAVRQVGLGAHTDDPPSLQLLHHSVALVVVADRIREVRALEGFSRYESEGRERLVSVNPVARAQWLPAVESYGEGIFISFNEDALEEWESSPTVLRWVEGIEGNLEASFQIERLREKTGPRLLPRFVMLHTLAHQFIRQLSYDSGYNAASLRERVYARSHPAGSQDPQQAGIFIYTAAGDSEGTLGGLVRQGMPPHLMDTMIRLLEAAQWCSQDPLCADSTGRSLANLNRAACHACTLLPETCCEIGNTLLDRILLIGDGQVEGFFRPVIQAAFEESAAAVDAP
ncbi:DrmB family protein [Streptomyces sp. NPDC127117]|uniref:DrmB family protein n=1 Tax=Streptomyces sp. NPDC127117 TaxID=3345368 RepID=UPI003633258B